MRGSEQLGRIREGEKERERVAFYDVKVIFKSFAPSKSRDQIQG